MSRPSKGIFFFGLVVSLFMAGAIFIAVKPGEHVPAHRSDVSAQVPPPVGTYDLLPTFTRMPPAPTSTPSPVPPPPAASTMPPIAGYAPNVAWGAITDNSLTLWSGRYSDSPAPAITGAKPLARWALPLDIQSMAASPNGRYLALLTQERCIPPTPEPTPTPRYVNGMPEVFPNTGEYCEGDWPQYIYVVDLLTNEVHHAPDYADYDLYARFKGSDVLSGLGSYWRILGWLDNDRFGVVSRANQMVLATRDGATFETRNFPNLTGRDFISDIDLLSDRKTLLVAVNGELYFRDLDSGKIRKADFDKRFSHIPAPNGASSAYIREERDPTDGHILQQGLWVRDLGGNSASLLFNGAVAGEPVWSPDSSRIAFTSVEIADPNSDTPTSDIHIADRAAKISRLLVDFQGARNTNLRWTPGGNLLLLSTGSGGA
ncbi:MAG: hypothetical protein QOH93_1675, partial [Chloroflexia bacterium]|nr:hypothetical protein [Chloroflexia bacterium]